MAVNSQVPIRNGLPVKRPNHKTQVLDLQSALYKRVMEPENKLSPTDLAAMCRAWCDLNDELRKLRGKPLPKAVDYQELAQFREFRRRKKPVEPADNTAFLDEGQPEVNPTDSP